MNAAFENSVQLSTVQNCFFKAAIACVRSMLMICLRELWCLLHARNE
jgi:hypothetical protein